MGRPKQSIGESIDLAKLRSILSALLRDLWPDLKHLPGLPVDVAAARQRLGQLDAEAARSLRALSDRLDALAGSLGLGGKLLDLETELRDVFRRAREQGLDRTTVEQAVAEQLDAAFRRPRP